MKKMAVVFLGMCLMIWGVGPAMADTIKIGLMGPMTGPWASEGQEMKQVLDLLADEVNKSGGINGMLVEIQAEDDAGDPRQASLAATRLTTTGAVAVIGTYGSSITEASQNIYDESGIIQVANGSTAIRLTEKGLKYFFRTCPQDDEQGKVAVQTLIDLGFKKVAILHDNTSFAKGLALSAQELLGEKDGVEIVFLEALTPGERDYNAILTKMKAAEPDGVLYTGYYPEAGLLLRQSKEMGWNITFVGSDGTNNADLVKMAGVDGAKGFHFVSAPLPKDLDTPEASGFVTEFQKRYGNAPQSIYAVLAGDGFRVVAEAIRQTQSTDKDKLADYLHNKLTDYPGLTGTISFNEKGDRVGEVYRVYKVNEKGEFILQP